MHEIAYRVPLRLDRALAPTYLIVNRGDEVLRGITVALDGPGLMPAMAATSMMPGASLEVRLKGRDLARSTALVVRWVRPDGRDYVVRFTF